MVEFLEKNSWSILSIFIGLVVSYFFYRLQKRDVTSASGERLKRAREELLDTLESITINKQQLTEGGIINLLAASERAHDVQLEPTCTPISLLQDIGLRLQRSRHLDVNQKGEYAQGIETLIKAISDDQRETPPSVKPILQTLDNIESSLATSDVSQARAQASMLRKQIVRSRIAFSKEEDRNASSIAQIVISGIAGLFASLTTLFSVSDFDWLNKLNGSTVSVIAAVVLAIGALTVSMRRAMVSKEAAADEKDRKNSSWL